jgi:hypothetical protein
MVVIEQAKLLWQVAVKGSQGPSRLDRPFLLVEHPFARFEKWLSETVLVAYLMATTVTVPAEIRHRARDLAASLAPLVAHRAYRRVWLRLPYSSVTSVGAAQTLLHDLGVGDSSATEDLKAAAAWIEDHWTERAARHSLERSWFWTRMKPNQGSKVRPDWPDMLPHPIYLLRSDMYTLTHDVWFGTDFGAVPLQEPSNLVDVLNASAPWLALLGDLDGLGEIIASLFMLGVAPVDRLCAAYRRAIRDQIARLAAQHERQAGWRLPFFAAPAPAPALTPVIDYHPIYVAIIAALARHRTPPAPQPESQESGGRAHAALVRLGEQQLQMYPAVQVLPRRELLDLLPAPAVLDGLLVMAVRQYRPDRIEELLTLHSVYHMPPSWTTQEAGTFAQRQSTERAVTARAL